MSFQISSQATSSSSGKVALFTRGKGVLKRVFRLDFDGKVGQAFKPVSAIIFTYSSHLSRRKLPRVLQKEQMNMKTKRYLIICELDLKIYIVTHTLTSLSLPAFRTPRKLYPNLPQSRFVRIHLWHKIKGASLLTRKYVQVCFTQRRRLSLPLGTCSSH